MSLKKRLKILGSHLKNNINQSNVYVSMENVEKVRKLVMETVIKDGKEIIVKYHLKMKN
jgi:hypothetical protein